MSNALPFECEIGFTGLPNAVGKYYVRHPKFTPSAERLYRYLLSRFNANYGYSFPSWNAIVRETALSRGTVSTALESLVELGLINRHNHSNGSDFDNKIYTFNRPIENEAEFNRKFSEEIAALKAAKKPKGGRKSNKKPAEIVDEPVAEVDDDTSWL